MRWTLVLVIFFSAGVARAAEGFDLLLTEGMAPCAIHVRANINESDALNTSFQWDFGDPQSPYNTLPGFNAAHLYTRAGQYTISLKEEIGGAVKTFTKKIFIAADRRRAVFISSLGSDTHTGLAEGNAVRSLARAQELVGDGTMLLLHRGEVFDSNAPLTIARRNVVIGAYGQGAPPVIRTAPRVFGAITVAQTAKDVVIQDLTFDSATPTNWNKDGAARAVQTAGTNIVMNRLRFTNVCDASNCELLPTGVLMQDCTAPTMTSLRAYFMWGAGSQLVVLGCKAGNSTREHIIRLGGADHVLIVGGDFGNISRQDQGDPQDIGKGTLVLQKCSWVYAAGNRLRNGAGIGPLPGADGVKDPMANAHCVVFEKNEISDGNINIHPGARDVCIRDNTLRLDGFPMINAVPTDATKLPDGQPAYPNRNLSNIQILHNTGINQSEDGTFFILRPGAAAGSITLKDNTYIAPNWVSGKNENAAVFVTGEDLTPFAEISGNTWARPHGGNREMLFYISPKWYEEGGYRTAEQWAKFPQVKGG